LSEFDQARKAAQDERLLSYVAAITGVIVLTAVLLVLGLLIFLIVPLALP
jgi:type IV secretory pathway component VirB8